MTSVTFDFHATTTVITGGASGIGLACAEAIVRAGGDVVISASRNTNKTQAALAQISKANPAANVTALPIDVGTESSVESFFGALATPIQFVINSAGISPNTDFFEQTQSEWDDVLNVNLTGSFLVLKHAALAMRSNPLPDEVGAWRGSILLVTSTNGINSNDPVSAHYDSSKAGANMLVKNAAELLAPQAIAVNGLAPGWIDTEMNATLPPDVRAKEYEKIWTDRWATPAEMADAALHILTMPYYTGQVLLADGGYR